MKIIMEFTTTLKDAQKAFTDLLSNPEATNEQRTEAYNNVLDALRKEVVDEARLEADKLVSDQYITKGFTSEERKFFSNEALWTKNTGMQDPQLLPEETVNRVFDDLTSTHPLLGVIGLKPAMMRTKVVTSTPEGTAVWGNVFDEIKGQLKASFKEEEFSQNKLTAFVVVPQDILLLGPVWIEKYVRMQITEAFAYALEDAFINGNGDHKPVGLKMDVTKAEVLKGVTTYSEKQDEGTLTLADPKTTFKEFSQALTKLRFKEDGKTLRPSMGSIYLLVNSCDYYNLKALFTNMNAQGVYVEALPLGVQLIESAVAPQGKGIFFLPDWYDAYTGSQLTLATSDEYAFLEDQRVYKAKWFAYGKARDNNVALVYALPSGLHTAEDTKAKKKA